MIKNQSLHFDHIRDYLLLQYIAFIVEFEKIDIVNEKKDKHYRYLKFSDQNGQNWF